MSHRITGGEDLPWGSHQPWNFPNSENSGGAEMSSGKKPLESAGNSPSPSVGEKRQRDQASKGETDGKGGGESDHEMHIWTERERRKKMRNMFTSLQALLPKLPPKADKSTIVDEAVNYIKTLQQNLHDLQKQKLERIRGVALEEPLSIVAATLSQGTETREAFMAEQGKNCMPMSSPTAVSIPRFPLSLNTWSSPNLVLSITGEDAHINICTVRKPGLLSLICFVLEKHGLEVVTANVSSDRFRSMFMFHVRATGISDQFPEALMIEDIYKSAVGEIMLWLHA